MYQLTKLEDLLKLLCANKAMQQQLVEALEGEIASAEAQAKDAACAALFNEGMKPKAYGAMALQAYLEEIRDFVKKQ